MSLNRLSGLFFVLAGLLLYFVIIPAETETVDYGWLRPQTIPNACAMAMTTLGALHALIPTGSISVKLREILKVTFFTAFTLLSLWLMETFGFLLIAPLFAGALMLLVGERRIGWLAGGAIVFPVAIWLAVVPLLERSLP
ncbi:MAG: hypothetical protein EP348_09825 [Alphaproteobacteria bacterium]|nr:MAG: hypothetical protein EP348_09825 [Alphaproteobacteria bacterium]